MTLPVGLLPQPVVFSMGRGVAVRPAGCGRGQEDPLRET